MGSCIMIFWPTTSFCAANTRCERSGIYTHTQACLLFAETEVMYQS